MVKSSIVTYYVYVFYIQNQGYRFNVVWYIYIYIFISCNDLWINSILFQKWIRKNKKKKILVSNIRKQNLKTEFIGKAFS